MLSHPRLILDPARCKRNILRITQKAKKLHVQFRPHFKTHQSIEVGRWFREQGVTGITVSSVDMARYFASDGWNDMTIAFPFYPGMMKGLLELQETADLRLFVNETDHIKLLNDSLQKPFHVYVEIDAGYGRSGVKHNDFDKIESLIKACSVHSKAQFYGFYIHDGGTYKAKGRDEIELKVKSSLNALQSLKKKYPDAVTSLGDTPSASILNQLDGIDEITPGNLVFYDWMQVQIGSCDPNDVAVWVDVPFAQQISEGKAIVHGGAVHFSKDFIESNGVPIYGQVVKREKDVTVPADGSFLSALSQEHGTITGFNHTLIQQDEFISILPIHSCLTVNLFDHYETPDGKIIDKRVLS